MGIPLRKPGVTGKKKFEFSYRPRTAEEMKKRATQTGSGRDTFIDGNVKMFTAKAGAFRVRPLPPTWDDAEHFGLEVHVHYGIGPDNAGYLCLYKMKGEACPLCEARQEAQKENDDELASALRPTKRVLLYLIDRAAEGDGPKVWASPAQKFDKSLCAQAWDPETGETIPVDSPDEGYDVTFSVEGQNMQKDYVGVQITRKSRPLSDDEDTSMEWLKYITDNPLPDVLVYHDYDHIKAAYEGKANAAPKTGAEEDAGSKPAKRLGVTNKKAAKEEPTDDDLADDAARIAKKGKPQIGGKKPSLVKKPPVEEEPEEPTLPTWSEVHEMDGDVLGELAEQTDVDFGDQEFKTLEACQDWICEQLNITEDGDDAAAEEEVAEEEEAPKKAAAGKPSLKDRLAGLRKAKK